VDNVLWIGDRLAALVDMGEPGFRRLVGA